MAIIMMDEEESAESISRVNRSLSIRGERLYIEACDVVELAERFGTPIFVVSESHVRENLRRYKQTLSEHWRKGPIRIMCAFKAAPLLALRNMLSEEGSGCDIFGPGELEGAIRGGVPPELISVNGSVKDRDMIHRAIELSARVVVDSTRELLLCEEAAKALGCRARVMVRVKPFLKDLTRESDFLPGAEIRELTQIIKYGVPTSELKTLVSQVAKSDCIDLVGVHAHMGRHSKFSEVWEAWTRHCVEIIAQIRDQLSGWSPLEIDLGGGFPSESDRDTDVTVQGYEGASLEEFAAVIATTLERELTAHGFDPAGITLEIEPGRGLHTDSGIHLAAVKNVKEEAVHRPRKWAEMDTSEVFLGVGGLNDTPPFDFMIASKAGAPKDDRYDLVGMSCNAEILFQQVATPSLEVGDIVALLNTGAYIEPMSANFNSLPRPGTVLVRGAQAGWAKRPETVDEVFARDQLPDFLKESKQ